MFNFSRSIQRRCVLVSLAIIFALLASAAPCSAKPRELRVPLEQGKLRSDDLTGNFRQHLGFGEVDWLNGDIDLRGIKGAVVVKALNAALGDGCNITLTDDESELVIRIDTARLPQDVDATKSAVRTFTAVANPEATAMQQRYYGLHLPLTREFVTDGSVPLVILIHGLDCNRSNWSPMAEMLTSEGFQVAYFAYPSDQALADSARDLTDQMAALRQTFPDVPVHLVAHSMGALVARSFVEGPDYPAIGGVKSLILLAPPNHGSKWAKLRAALEVQEHYKLWRDEPRWRPSWPITDGLGEAGRDLRAGSAFLAQLNAQPRRDEVRYTIITGNQHPALRMSANCVEAAASAVPSSARSHWGVRHYVRMMENVAEDLRETKSDSDGPVRVDSARLEGVNDFTVVEADHSTLYIPSEPGVRPQAWDVVVDRLKKK